MRAFWNNLLDTATLTASSEDSTLIVEHLTHVHKTKVWRVDGTLSSDDVVADLTTAASVTSAIILAHTIPATATIKIQGNDTDEWSSPSVDETITHSTGTMAKAFTGGSHRYWRLFIDKDDPGDQFDIGRLFIGTYTTLPQPRNYSEQFIDPSEVSKAVGGQTYTYAKTPYKQVSLSYNTLSETNYQLLETLFDSIGTHTPLFLQVNTASPVEDYQYLRIVNAINRKYQYATCGGSYFWASDLTLEEQI